MTTYRFDCHPHTPEWVIRPKPFFEPVFNKHSEFFRELNDSYFTEQLWEDLERAERGSRGESSLDDVLEVKVIGTEETERKIGTEYEEPSSKSLALPPYYLLVRENGYLKAQVDIFKNQIEGLKTKIKLFEEQLTYHRSSWINRIFRR